MDQETLNAALADLDIPAIRYYATLGSTNDAAAEWLDEGAPDGALVVADEQTAGRGRGKRTWLTRPGVSLAFSMVMYPEQTGIQLVTRLTALGALAVREALQCHYELEAQIKWPNDVLVKGFKVAGVLAETRWSGEQLRAAILGIGINVAADSTSDECLPRTEMLFPASSVEEASGHQVDRLELLHHVLKKLFYWKPRMYSDEFLNEWESCLAFRGKWVQVSADETPGTHRLPVQRGKVLGLAMDGSLKLMAGTGEVLTIQFGEVRLGTPI